MPNFKVSYYKNLLSSDGHNFKCLQQRMAVDTNDPIEALKRAHREVAKTHPNIELNADSVEVTPVTQVEGTS